MGTLRKTVCWRYTVVIGAIFMATTLMVIIFSWNKQLKTTRVSHFLSRVMEYRANINASESPLKEEKEVKPVPAEKVLLLFWSTYFGSTLSCGPKPHKLCNNSRLQNCKVPCEITTDRKRAASATAMIIHTRDPSPLPPQQYKHIPLILFGVENPVYTPTLYNKEFLARFNYLFSYNLQLSDFYVPSFDKPSLKPAPLKFSQKNGTAVLAVFSHCETARTAYLKELMKHIKVDSYGKCLNNNKGLIPRSNSNFEEAKIELARRYKFTLVFFNQDCDYFVDDQLTHALTAGSVPVYMGTERIHELMAGNLRDAFIKVKDFKSPKKLAEYLQLLSENEALYNRYLRWKYDGFGFPSNFSSTKHGLAWSRDDEHPYPDYCYICEKFAENKAKGKAIKPVGLLKPEYCTPRKVSDWLKQ